MGYLMRLEFRKYHLMGYLKGVIICILCLIGMNILMINTSKQEAEYMFDSFGTALTFLDVMNRATFLIFSSVLLSKLTVEEYRTKTIQLMYSYPISRKKIMLAKLLIVFGFTVVTVLAADAVVIPVVGSFSNSANALPTKFTVDLLMEKVPILILGSIFSGFISLVPFYFGMKRKSTSATIITSCILAILLTSSVGDNMSKSYVLRMLVIGGISLVFVVFTLNSKINNLQDEEGTTK